MSATDSNASSIKIERQHMAVDKKLLYNNNNNKKPFMQTCWQN